MTKRIRRQHVVSQFYLRGFANEARQLRRIVLPGDRSHLIATSDASVVKDFYTVVLPDGRRSDMFERVFAAIEQPASASLREILAGRWPLPPQQRMDMASWIALQHLRAEKIRRGAVDHEAMIIRMIVGVSGKRLLREVIERHEQRAVCDAELDWEWCDLTKPGGPDLMPETDAHVKFVMDMHAGLSRYLFASHWSLLTFDRRTLLTTDQPVVMVTGPDHPRWQGVGFATADAFLVALSRRRALVIQPWINDVPPGEHGPDIVVPGTTLVARWTNAELTRQALQHIYLHPDDTLTNNLRLPQPNRRQWDSTDADRLISEEGIFHGVDPAQLAALGNSQAAAGNGTSFSIDDLPWPIPRRVTPNRPTQWADSE